MDTDYRGLIRRLQGARDVSTGMELLGLLDRTAMLGPLHSQRVFRELETYFGGDTAQDMMITYGHHKRHWDHRQLAALNAPVIEAIQHQLDVRGWIGPQTRTQGFLETDELIYIDSNDQVLVLQPCPACEGGRQRSYCYRCEVEPPCSHLRVGETVACRECYQGQAVERSFHIYSGNSFSRYVWNDPTPPGVDIYHGCNLLLESVPRNQRVLTLHGFLYHAGGGNLTVRLPITVDNVGAVMDVIHDDLRDIAREYFP